MATTTGTFKSLYKKGDSLLSRGVGRLNLQTRKVTRIAALEWERKGGLKRQGKTL